MSIRMIGANFLALLAGVSLLADKPLRTGKGREAPAAIREVNQKQAEAYGRLPIYFEPNRGQAGEGPQFLARGAGYQLRLSGSEATMMLARMPEGILRKRVQRGAMPETEIEIARMRLLGARGPTGEGMEPTGGVSNYLIGRDSNQWRTGVPHFGKVKFPSVYAGVDLVYYGKQRELEYDFVVAPYADPRAIRMAFDGVKNVRVAGNGDLVLELDGGEVRQRRPKIYQWSGGKELEVAGGYQVKGGEVMFAVAAYDRRLPLVIDPVLDFATFIGGNDWDGAYRMAVDSSGNTYITGPTVSTNLRGTSAASFQRYLKVPAYYDAFLVKLNPQGNQIVFSTYFGGSGNDDGVGVALDPDGSIYLGGRTSSADFPVAGGSGLQLSYGGNRDGFLAKLNATGSRLIYSTYLGGPNYDEVLTVEYAAGQVYVGGDVGDGFKAPNSTRTTGGGIIGKYSATSLRLQAVYYIGGNNYNYAFGVSVDAIGNVYATGGVGEAGLGTGGSEIHWQTPCPYPNLYLCQDQDAFVMKLDPNLTEIYFTYVGGTDYEEGRTIAVNSAGEAYAAGELWSTDSGADSTYGRNGLKGDAFIVKVDANGQITNFGLFGGSDRDFANSIQVDAAGSAYCSGFATSTDFPDMFGGTAGSGFQTFLVRVTAMPSSASTPNTGFFYRYVTLLRSGFSASGNQSKGVGANEIAVDPSGNVYLAGTTASVTPNSVFPGTTSAFPFGGGSYDAFVAKLAAAQMTATAKSYWYQRKVSSPAQAPYSSGLSKITEFGLSNTGSTQADDCRGGWTGSPPTGSAGVSCVAGCSGGLLRGNLAPGGALRGAFQTNFTGTPGPSAGLFTDACGTNAPNRPFPPTEEGGSGPPKGSNCGYQVGSGTLDAGSGASTTDVVVTASLGCGWIVDSQPSFVTTSLPQGYGDSSGPSTPIRISVPQNTGQLRSGNIVIRGVDGVLATLTVNQAGLGAVGTCSYQVNPTSQTLAAGGGQTSFTVTTTAGCPWTAASSVGWMQVTSGASVTGAGSVQVSYDVNTSGAPRTASLTIAGQGIPVVQQMPNQVQIYNDVPVGHPYFDYITLMQKNAITSGCGPSLYCPDASTTRSQMAVFIVRAHDGGDVFPFTAQPYFMDVPTSHPHFKWVQRLRDLGITVGCGSTTYCPDSAVTRGQMAVFLIRGKLGITSQQTFPYVQTPYFTDVPSTHAYFPYIQKMREFGITVGCSATSYCPDSSTTRGQMAAFLIRSFFTP